MSRAVNILTLVALVVGLAGCTPTVKGEGAEEECLGGPCVLVVDVGDVGEGADAAGDDGGGSDAHPIDTGSDDLDGDGFVPPEDCDDGNAAVSPAASERCDDRVDNDCDGQIDEGCSTTVAAQVGDACARPEVCESGQCIGGWPGGYCTAACGQAQCPAGSRCYDIGAQAPACLRECSSRAQCRGGYTCVPTDAGGACGPACAGDADCGGGTCDVATGLCGGPVGTNNENPPPAGTPSNETIVSAGRNRSYVVYMPSSIQAGTPAPLVLTFHGHGDTATNFFTYTQLAGHADQRGFVLVALQGDNGTWDAYTSPAQNPDVSFAVDVVARLRSQVTIDNSRIYLIGYSQGGFFTFALGMWHADTFAAMNTQASSNPAPGSGLVAGAARPIPLYMLIGTADSLLSQARATRDSLQAVGHPLQYEELPGVGHCCYQSAKNGDILTFLFDHRL